MYVLYVYNPDHPQGHTKVVKYLVEHVTQFPSDADLTRYINTLSDKVSSEGREREKEKGRGGGAW